MHVSPGGGIARAGEHGLLIWLVGGNLKMTRHGAGRFGSALGNESHGEPGKYFVGN
jgi:hypothetical protein